MARQRRHVRTRPSTLLHRLSGLDGVFLAVENERNPMNIGSVGFFEGPAPTLQELHVFLMSRLSAVPRCRQRLHEPLGSVARPVWVDDIDFDLTEHVDEVSLTQRDFQDIEDLVAGLLAFRLDRRRPLWHVWLVSGLEDGRWAVVAKVHHCMVDGIGGSDLLSAFLTEERSPSLPLRAETILDEPSTRAVLWFTIRSVFGSGLSRIRRAIRGLTHPLLTGRRLSNLLTAAKRLWYHQPHRHTSLVGPIGTGRCWSRTEVPLSNIHTIQNSLGGTVNDVVLAAVSCGFRDFFLARGENLDRGVITAMVPVSLRTTSDRSEMGNFVANVHALLPLDDDDPRSVLERVSKHLIDLKNSHETDATGLLMHIGEHVPRFVADRVARAVFHRQRNVETVITNVPGPHSSLFLGSHRMIAAYPVAPIGGLVRTTIALWSYCEHLYIGITGDKTSIPDIERLRDGISHGFDALFEVARRSIEPAR